MKSVVPNMPSCRHCSTPVKPLRKCPKCGKRSILAFFLQNAGTRW